MLDIVFSAMLIACTMFYIVSMFRMVIEVWETNRVLAAFGVLSLLIVLCAVAYVGVVVMPF